MTSDRQDKGTARGMFDPGHVSKLIPPGICLDCGKPAPRDGCHQCERCRIKAWADENERTSVMDDKPF